MNAFSKIYDVVKRIPRGCVATYGQVASYAGSPRWARVVGYALHVNPEPGVIPCHRVVTRFGEVSRAFAFGGENMQRTLLTEEGVEFDENGRVDLKRFQWKNSIRYTDIVWDWNGTLLCDVDAALASVNDMLRRRGSDEIDIERYRECIGVPIIRFYEQVFNLQNEDYPSLIAEYNEGYLLHLKECSLTSGVPEILQKIADSGARQIIVSSCEKNQLLESVKRYGIDGYFDAVIGSDDFFAGSKIEKAQDWFLANSSANTRALVIGDLAHDKELALAIGADCVLLSCGHEHRARLEEAGVPVYNNVHNIWKIIAY